LDTTGLFPYFLTVAALAAAPGPLMAVLVARSLGNDVRGAAAFATGLCLGDAIAVCAAAFGIGLWIEGQPQLLSVLKLAGVGYLLWLAAQMWNSASGQAAAATARPTGLAGSVGAGLALCLGNPATLLLFVLLLPSAAPHGLTGPGQVALIALVTLAAGALVFFGTIVIARQARNLIGTGARSALPGRVLAAMVALTSLWILAV
jgi:threonine/homoserine/homoserine lactone efflux protein